MIMRATDPTLSPPGKAPQELVTAIRRLFRPLGRLLLSHHITYTFLANLLKGIYVNVAEKEFPVAGRRQSDSRISLLTGVHRKDVRRLRKARETDEPPPKAVSLAGQIIARWSGTPEYLCDDGKPKALRRLASADQSCSFEALVKSVSKQDIRARVVLDELVRLGVVIVDSEDRVHLKMEAFIPKEGLKEKAYYLGQNIGDHIAAGTHNLLDITPPMLDRSVYYDSLTSESVGELARLAEETGMKALQEVNKRALELQAADEKKVSATQRMNFGVFFFSAVKDPTSESGTDEQ